jgi:hypothetical protein
MYVCEKWNSAATQAYFEEIDLDANQIHKIKELFEENLPNKEDYFKKLHWTKK